MAKQTIQPVIRVAPLGELKVCPVTESALNESARGSPASVHLTFALSFLSAALSFFVALLATDIPSIRVFTVFMVLLAATAIAAVVFFVFWFVQHRSSKNLVAEMKGRMPPAAGIQEPAEGPTAAGAVGP